MKNRRYSVIFAILLSISGIISCGGGGGGGGAADSSGDAGSAGSTSSEIRSAVSGVIERELEAPMNTYHGYGTFGHPWKRLSFDEKQNILPDRDYTDNTPLGELYDINADGPFNGLVRIVEDGLNLADPAGRGLTPYAKDLSQLSSPPKDRFYIDPYHGRYVLPRPSFWSRFETWTDTAINDVAAPALQEDAMPPSLRFGADVTSVQSVAGKFGQALQIQCYGDDEATNSARIMPFGDDAPLPEKGTLSAWIKKDTAGRSQFIFLSGDTDKVKVIIGEDPHWGNSVITYIDGDWTMAYGDDVPDLSDWTHVYIVWDAEGGLNGGNTIAIYLNGQLVLDRDMPFPLLDDTEFTLYPRNMEDGSTATLELDNIKVFSHVASEDPSWEYNEGNGREEALHPIYSPDADFRPVLTGAGNGVGFFYVNSTIQVPLEDTSLEHHGAGSFGPARIMTDNEGVALAEGNHFTYDSTIDEYGDSPIYDIYNSDDFETGRFMRIVSNGLNVTDPGDCLYAMVKARDLSGTYPATGYYDTFVDPVNNRFVLPRPSYWCKMEDADNLADPEICDGGEVTIEGAAPAYTAGKFGNALYLYGNRAPANGWVTSSINHEEIASFKDSGTISTWFKTGNVIYNFLAVGSNVSTESIFIEGGYINISPFGLAIYDYSNGLKVGLYTGTTRIAFSAMPRTADHSYHVYIVWENTDASDWIKVYINGALAIDYNGTFPEIGDNPTRITMKAGQFFSLYGTTIIDNLKIFPYVVSESPEWEYNGGTGREEALHPTYGSSTGYRPVLTGEGNGVGYYHYVPFEEPVEPL